MGQVGQRHTQLAHRVPYSLEVNRLFAAVLEEPLLLPRHVGRIVLKCEDGWGVTGPVSLIKLLERERRTWFQQSTFSNEPGKTSSGEGSPRKAKNEDAAFFFKIFDKPLVSVDYFLINSKAK